MIRRYGSHASKLIQLRPSPTESQSYFGYVTSRDVDSRVLNHFNGRSIYEALQLRLVHRYSVSIKC